LAKIFFSDIHSVTLNYHTPSHKYKSKHPLFFDTGCKLATSPLAQAPRQFLPMSPPSQPFSPPSKNLPLPQRLADMQVVRVRHDSEVQGGGKVAVRGEEAKPSNIPPEQERCWHNGRRKNLIIVIGICPYLTKSLRWNWRIERTRTGVGCQKRWPIRTLEWTKWCTICYTTEKSLGHTFELCNQHRQSYRLMIG